MMPSYTPSVISENKYLLQIFYLDGADSYSQECNIYSQSPLDYNSFIYYLKKKLGIYEHAKFKLILLDSNREERQFLNSVNQLKYDEVNELKIVPFDYVLRGGNEDM
jgi:hypothetical protein